MKFVKQKGISSIVIILIIVGLLVIAGGVYYFTVQKPAVCSVNGEYEKIKNYYSISSNSILLVVKNGINRETFVNNLKGLNLYNQSERSLALYSPISRSELAIKSPPDIHFNQIKELLRNVQGDNLDETASFSEEIAGEYIVSSFFFKSVLSDVEKESLISSITSSYIIETFWYPHDPQYIAHLSVSSGNQKQVIEKLKKLEIFKCVSADYLDTRMLPAQP
mgnify:CR=1 FL=1